MANIEMRSNGNRRKNKPDRKTLRVDFTPMVDMNMLLITFFMFCTTLSIPQIMDIAMPSNEPTGNIAPNEVPESRTITAILGANDKVYYYHGKPDYKNYSSLKETDTRGFRDILIAKNADVTKQIKELREQLRQKKITDSAFKNLVAQAKKSDKSAIVIIKPTKDSYYKNLVDILDEMQICNIAKYTIADIAEGDDFLLENYKSKGSLTAQVE